MRIRAEEEERRTNRNVRPGSRIIESERNAIERDPLLADLIDFG